MTVTAFFRTAPTEAESIINAGQYDVYNATAPLMSNSVGVTSVAVLTYAAQYEGYKRAVQLEIDLDGLTEWEICEVCFSALAEPNSNTERRAMTVGDVLVMENGEAFYCSQTGFDRLPSFIATSFMAVIICQENGIDYRNGDAA